MPLTLSDPSDPSDVSDLSDSPSTLNLQPSTNNARPAWTGH
jgi:hypothetical protein